MIISNYSTWKMPMIHLKEAPFNKVDPSCLIFFSGYCCGWKVRESVLPRQTNGSKIPGKLFKYFNLTIAGNARQMNTWKVKVPENMSTLLDSVIFVKQEKKIIPLSSTFPHCVCPGQFTPNYLHTENFCWKKMGGRRRSRELKLYYLRRKEERTGQGTRNIPKLEYLISPQRKEELSGNA